MTNPTITRCHWATTDFSIPYHDGEWGVPLHDDRRLFEYIILDGAQAGLSWETILRKREGYRRAFAEFDPVKVARFNDKKIERLMADASIVRNRLKITSSVSNASAFLKVQEEFGTFDAYIWRFVDGRPMVNTWTTMKQIPAQSPLSQAMSKELIGRGFRFVGPTICYAFMQAAGMVNDHLVDCFRHRQVSKTSGI
jgi:DNA-3-methyladenine glycosylase I